MQGGKSISKSKDPGGGKEKLTDQKPELVPPDGGWGWVIVFAFALSNVIVVPIIQSFGLLFRGRLEQLDISGTDAAVIINVNSSFGMILGLFSGYLLRIYGYRKVAICGSLIYALGVTLTSYANTFAYFVVTYGLISSIGFNLLTTSFNLAINSYFRERRSKAVGFATTAMGLGPVCVPLIISKLMESYGTTGTALLLGGFSLHSLVAALLLQPVKWHMKPKKVTPEILENGKEEENMNENDKLKSIQADGNTTKRHRTITGSSSIDHDIDTQSIYGFETPLPEHRVTPRRSMASYKRSTSHIDGKPPADSNWWTSATSLDTVNLGSSMKIFDEMSYQPLQEIDEDNNQKKERKNNKTEIQKGSKTNLNHTSPGKNGVGYKEINAEICDKENEENEDKDENDEKKEKEQSFWQKIGSGLVSIFDLGLLKDPIYVNLMLGMSIAICAEYNFSLLTPFILNDRGFDTQKTAVIMAVIAALDIVFRFIVPFFSDYYKIEARHMYCIALIMLASSRTALIFSESFDSVMTVAVALGVAKGVRTVYMTIVIPCYVPIERLAAASGIQMLTNGILLMIFGPLMGVIRDVSGSYNLCIGFINFLTLSTLVMWTVEMLIIWHRNHRKETEEEN